MSKIFFVDDKVTGDGKYRVLQEDSETKERFGVKDFDTREEAEKTADDLQRAANQTSSEITTGELPHLPSDDNSEMAEENKFKDTPQDLKDETSQD
ncbi:MAG TPA: hypothetical protein VGB00_17205 [Pyrinomonadaceae bacterium]